MDYADDINVLGGSLRTVKKNAEAVLVASNEIRLEGNVDKSKYMAMSRDQNAGRSHNIKIDDSSFEKGRTVQIFGTNLTT